MQTLFRSMFIVYQNTVCGVGSFPFSRRFYYLTWFTQNLQCLLITLCFKYLCRDIVQQLNVQYFYLLHVIFPFKLFIISLPQRNFGLQNIKIFYKCHSVQNIRNQLQCYSLRATYFRSFGRFKYIQLVDISQRQSQKINIG